MFFFAGIFATVLEFCSSLIWRRRSLAESDSDNEQNAVVHDMMSRVAEQAGDTCVSVCKFFKKKKSLLVLRRHFFDCLQIYCTSAKLTGLKFIYDESQRYGVFVWNYDSSAVDMYHLQNVFRGHVNIFSHLVRAG